MTRTIIIIVLLAHILALLGLVGYGAVTGRFDSEKMQQYLATWKGEKLVPYVEDEVVEEVKESPQAASAKIEKAQVEHEFLNWELQRKLQLSRNMQVTVTAAQNKLKKELEELQVDQQSFIVEREKQKKAAQDEGFRKTLKNFSAMKPKYVKNDFMKMDEKDVVRFLSAMKTDTATDILNQFKTDEEQEKRIRFLKLLQESEVIQPNEKK